MFQTAEVTFKVTQGHLMALFDMPHPISNCFYTCTVYKISSLIYQNLMRLRHLEHTPFRIIFHAKASTCHAMNNFYCATLC